MFERLRLWLLRKLSKQVSNPQEDPSFGFFSTAKPYASEQDMALSDSVGKMLAGDLDPGKRLVRLEFVAYYEDDSRQCLFSTTEQVHVTSMRSEMSTHFDIVRPLSVTPQTEERKHQWPGSL